MSEEQQAIRALEKIALEGLNEQKRARRWKIFFRFVFLGLGVFFLLSMVAGIVSQGKRMIPEKEFAAVIDVQGVIMDGADVSYEVMAPALKDAFSDSRTRGVILKINSPGGSAVQSAMIYDEIRRLRDEFPDMPVYAVIEDVGASGGYYIAAAADEIYANKSSIVGSIGVRLDSFGVEEAARKLGIESRQITAGEHKAILDPFRPVSAEEQAHLQTMLKTTHEQFIEAVRAGRGDRLVANDDVFSGLFWAGVSAKELGLIDGFRNVDEVARDLVGTEAAVDFVPPKSFLDKLAGQVQGSLSQLLLEQRLTPQLAY